MGETREFVTYVNGRFIPHSEALTEMSADGSSVAGGLYDAERTFNGDIFKLHGHLKRLYNGLEHANIDPGVAVDEMESLTLQVLDANRELLEVNDDFILGQVVSTSPSADGDGARQVNIVIDCQYIDFPIFAQSYLKGVRVVTPITYAVPANAAGGEAGSQKTYSLLNDLDGNITECRHANFLFVLGGRVKLPDRSKVLPGISMETVVELAEKLGIPVDEGDYSTYDVYEAEEAFITGTRYCMLPVATLNGLEMRGDIPGEVTKALMDSWFEKVGVDFVQQAVSHLPHGLSEAPPR